MRVDHIFHVPKAAQARFPLAFPLQWLNDTTVLLIALAAGLVLIELGGQRDSLPVLIAGVLVFGLLAYVQPRLALLYVPLTAPLYLIPINIPGIRYGQDASFLLPIHELILLITFLAFIIQHALQVSSRLAFASGRLSRSRPLRWTELFQKLRYWAPASLFLIAGLLGIIPAIAPAPALRELRWLILEPLLFYALLHYYLLDPSQGRQSRRYAMQLIGSMLLAGSLVALISIVQFGGYDLSTLFGQKQCTCDSVMTYGNARRVSSVYGSPNNLALLLERVWPLAALLLYAHATRRRRRTEYLVVFGVVAALCLIGILLSFSRGALFASSLAVVLLWMLQRSGQPRIHTDLRKPWSIALLLAVLGIAVIFLVVRNDSLMQGSSVRILLWKEALGYIRLHPYGIGLDQFLYYHMPTSGRSLIDPSLVDTTVAQVSHPHNLLLDTWLRIGPIGVIAFAWLLIRFFRATQLAVQQGRSSPILAAVSLALLVLLLHGLVDQFYFVPDLALAFWMLIALGQWALRSPE